MKQQYVTIIIVGLLMAGITYVGVTKYHENRTNEFISSVEADIESQNEKLAEMTEAIGKNKVDDVTGTLVQDCSIENRTRFDNLLDRLADLTTPELNEIQLLFDGCAGFFALQKAVMVTRMEQEFNMYRTLVSLYDTFTGSSGYETYKVSQWEQLIELQKKRSEIATGLVSVQREIIVALQKGSKVESEEVQSMLAKARNYNEESFVVSQQANELRNTLIKE